MEKCNLKSCLLPPLPIRTGKIELPVQKTNIEWTVTKQKEEELHYEGEVAIPMEFQEHQIFLRMDSVGCEAKVTIEDNEIRQHHGSYTQWDCDLTKEARGKKVVKIHLVLISKEEELSPYQMAGIHRGISVLALPEYYISSLYTETKAAENGEMRLEIQYRLSGIRRGCEEIEVILMDPDGKQVHRSSSKPQAITDEDSNLLIIDCNQVKLWDSENPNLYQLRLLLKREGTILEEVQQRIGFRHLDNRNGEVLWNHQPLKLRGICYREPLSTERNRDIREELKLFQHANINYIRGLFYPFSKEFLDICDEMGFYVEQTTAVNEVGQTLPATQNAPELKDSYMGQLTDMLERDRNHVSILLWSLGSDCTWGDNFRQEYRQVKRMDQVRLVNFHYPMSIPEEEIQMDVWSVTHVSHKLSLNEHYDHMVIFHTHGSNNEIGYAIGAASDYEMPVLHEVFAHIPCYNRDQLERDPGIHEYWGESIKRFWDKMWQTNGCLGGAVMAGVDEDGSFHQKLKNFNWGILDAFGQPKPEYHHIRMAYAPIVVTEGKVLPNKLMVTVENRFNHTNLTEAKLVWTHCGISGEVTMKGKPREKQLLEIPISRSTAEPVSIIFQYHGRNVYETIFEVKLDEAMEVRRGEKFESYGTVTIDEKKAVINEKDIDEDKEASDDTMLTLSKKEYPEYFKMENSEVITLDNGIYSFSFSKKTSLMMVAAAEGIPLMIGGPYLQTTRLKLEEWEGHSITVNTNKEGAHIRIEGEYGCICSVRFDLQISKNGEIDTTYLILSLSKPMPHTVKANIGMDPGGLDELGVWFLLASDLEEFSWNRKGLWQCYPSQHIGRRKGITNRKNKDDFRSMKHHIIEAMIKDPINGAGILLTSNENHSLRLEEIPEPSSVIDDRDQSIRYYGNWYEMDDYCGNYNDTETLSGTKGNYLEYKFTGTGIQIYGPTDMLYGKSNIYLNGELVAEGVSQYPEDVDFPAMSRGYEKRYRQIMYQVSGLSDSEHMIKIEVLGDKDRKSQSTYVSLDYMVIESPRHKNAVKMIINNDYNYTRLVRGNYMREKVSFETGYQNRNKIRIIRPGEEVNV